MVQNVKLKKKLVGLNKLMTSPPVQSEVNRRAAKIAAAAGPKYEMIVQGKRKSRLVARSYIQARDDARTTDADERGLLGAIDAGRG